MTEILLLILAATIIIIVEMIIYYKVTLPVKREQKKGADYTMIWSEIRNIN